MQDTKLKYLFERYFQKLATAQELEEFLTIIEEPANKKEVEQAMENYWNKDFVPVNPPFSEMERDEMFALIVNTEHATVRLWPRIAVAAAVVFTILFAGLFYINYNSKPGQYANNVAPGKEGAMLTLANGKQIRLSAAVKGELAKEAGVSITKTGDGQLVYEIKDRKDANANMPNMLATAKGETYKVRLPDGSVIWLNAATTLKYPASFAALKARKVQLIGEAYFEIAKDKAHPFIVETEGQSVEVLGTHFNINSYADEKITKTTLLEGSVKVSATQSKQSIKISPGEEAVNLNQQLQIRPANLQEAIAWKEGYFRFTDNNLENIMRQVSRWYNVDVVYTADQSEFEALRFWGFVSREKNISEVLKIIERTGKVKFNIKGRTITVMK